MSKQYNSPIDELLAGIDLNDRSMSRHHGSHSEAELSAHFRKRGFVVSGAEIREFYLIEDGRDSVYLCRRDDNDSHVVVTDRSMQQSIIRDHDYIRADLCLAAKKGLKLR